MSDGDSGNISFDIDERARLFAFDLDRDGNIGLIPLFYDITTVAETVNELATENGVQTDEIQREVSGELRTDLNDNIEPLLEFLEEIDYLERNQVGNWSAKSSGLGASISYL